MLTPGANIAMSAADRCNGNCRNCSAVIVVTWLVVLTSIGGIALAVTTTPLRFAMFLPPDADEKSTATAPPATGLTSS